MNIRSEIGDMCDPAIEPDIIAPRSGNSIGICDGAAGVETCDSVISMGTPIGINNPKDPQAVPINVAIATAVAKKMNGKKLIDIEPNKF